jgi:hypothetical protein
MLLGVVVLSGLLPFLSDTFVVIFSHYLMIYLVLVSTQGPDYMVRTAKKSMLEELEGMLEIVDPQPPGKQRSLSRRKFDLPEGWSDRS